MSEIRKLPDHLVNLIAAGEVVERPASVVKELLENSLDAGASTVEIELEAGGRKLIAVRDNGAGMDRHDVLLAIQRHATSKITSPSDLNDITTLGFRGEALPSIASVSRMTILTSRGETGWKLIITGGKLDSLEPAGRTRGTTITVENLFFNQPARRKFLRSESTELAWIERIVAGASLARVDCSFNLKHNGRVIFQLPVVNSPAQRLRDRYGLTADERCVEATGQSDGVKAKLYVFPDKRWANRRHQYTLVNGRLVTAYQVSAPLREAFSGPAGEPLILCAISIDPSLVDVNAHPAKREVRFRKPYQVESAVRSAVPGIAAHRMETTVSSFRTTAATPSTAPLSHISYSSAPYRVSKPSPAAFQTAMEFESPGNADISSAAIDTSHWEDSIEMIRISGSYLVTETSTGLLIVDQHAAHERILYEKIIESVRGAMSAGQQRILLPEEITVDEHEKNILKIYSSMIKQAGYDFRIEGDTLELLSVPVGIKRGTEALKEVVKSLAKGTEVSESEAERIASASACAGAIKFGDKISLTEARHLFHTLFTMKDPFHCPHGRPTMIELPFNELETRFGR
ncbi:MAG: DNA mismatch repair endonuclease MutL [Candidatus Sabulitectum sp.]|nr:DNA mismatch repair endonuclease MutL [Candidatus Sabulitectum sp.]